MIEILLPGWIAGILLIIIVGPLGSFIIWRQMSYIGDALAHVSLLGVAFGLLFNINLFCSIIIIMIFVSLILSYLEQLPQLTVDTSLGIIAHTTFSLALVIISLMNNVNIDLITYLFGDLLSVTIDDVIFIAFFVFIISIIIIWKWDNLLAITINQDLSFVDGINIQQHKILLMLITAITIGLAMKFIGVLMISSLLIIPPAISRYISNTPEQMAINSIIFGTISITIGLLLSAYCDTPAGPSVVLIGSILFVIILFFKQYINN